MDDAGVVHLVKRVHDRQHELKDCLRLHPAVLFEICRQRIALQIFHDDVGGVVLGKVIAYIDDAVFLREFGDILRLSEELFLAVLEVLALVLVIQRDVIAQRIVAVGVAVGIELLDGDLQLKVQIEADIRDAEAAFADGVAHQIFVVEDGALTQVMRHHLHFGALSAVRALPSAFLQLCHTVITVHRIPHSAVLH